MVKTLISYQKYIMANLYHMQKRHCNGFSHRIKGSRGAENKKHYVFYNIYKFCTAKKISDSKFSSIPYQRDVKS